MSKNNMLLGYARGKVGDLVFSRRKGQQITRAYNPNPVNPQSSAQMTQRTKLAGLVTAYRCMRTILDHSFSPSKPGQTSYNAFVSANMPIAPFLSKEQAEQGVVVVLPYKVSNGTLSRIFISGSGDNALTNIALGSLEITNDTTIQQLTQAIIDNNADWQEGDQLTYLSVIQTALPGETMFPHASAQEFKVTLSLSSQETVRSYLPDYASATVDGYLGHGAHYASGGFCWIHSRKDASGALLVSSQELVVNYDASYWTSAEQEDTAKRSYGMTPERYLVPGLNNSSPVDVSTEVVDAYIVPGTGAYDSFALRPGNRTAWLPNNMSAETTAYIQLHGSNLGGLSDDTVTVRMARNNAEGVAELIPVQVASVDQGQVSSRINLTFTGYTPLANGIYRISVQYNRVDLFVWDAYEQQS